jgi:hypothetical protein
MRKLVTIATRAAITAVLAVTITASLAALASPAQARQIAWCARTSSNDFNGDCMYYTYDQCLAAISGQRGECMPNPFATSGAEPSPRHRHHAHHRHGHHHHRHHHAD